MAQSKSFYTHRHGSTKSHTYATMNGQQITKDRVELTTNQRTDGQMAHRCLIHTMSDAHAWLRPYFGNLWNGAPAGRAQLSAFREANYALLRKAAFGGLAGYTFSPYMETTIPMGYFQVTHGSLPYSGHLFQNGVNGVDGAVSEFFNVTQAGSSWYEALASIGLKPLDKLALFIFIYTPASGALTLDTFNLQITDHSDVVIGQQGSDDLVSVTPSKVTNEWQITKEANRIVSLTLPKQTHDISDSILITCCFQVGKSGSKLLCSDGFLWHWDDNVNGLTFPQALATYPMNAVSLNAPAIAPQEPGVDLGLPSGTIWHECNLGASSPKETGLYYAWSVNEGHAFGDGYDFSNSNWIAEGGINSNRNIYPNDGQDAAREALGGDWRMPTSDEFAELIENTDSSIIEQDGNKFMKLISKTDSSKYIIFPLAGYCDGLTIDEVNLYANLWTSQSYSKAQAITYYLGDDGADIGKSNKYFGFSIRPVRSQE